MAINSGRLTAANGDLDHDEDNYDGDEHDDDELLDTRLYDLDDLDERDGGGRYDDDDDEELIVTLPPPPPPPHLHHPPSSYHHSQQVLAMQQALHGMRLSQDSLPKMVPIAIPPPTPPLPSSVSGASPWVPLKPMLQHQGSLSGQQQQQQQQPSGSGSSAVTFSTFRRVV